MYATAKQLDTYRSVNIMSLSGREIEAAALTKAAFLLKDCQNNWEADDREAKLSEALKMNQMVWTIFQTELARNDNPLPKKIREDILVLSIFVDKRIMDSLADPSSEKLQIIVDINLNLAAGLRGSPA